MLAGSSRDRKNIDFLIRILLKSNDFDCQAVCLLVLSSPLSGGGAKHTEFRIRRVWSRGMVRELGSG